MKLNKLFFKTAISAVLLSLTGAALAGSVTTPATDAASFKYATEGLAAPAAITLPAVVYSLGVTRAIGQNFTFIVTPSAGSLDATTCTNVVWVGSAGLNTATKRASATECALDVTVSAATAVGATITGTGIKFTATPLATAGSSITFNVALKDPGETSFIDNSGSVTRVVAAGVNAINIYAFESDTRTSANVNDPNGPLRGFTASAAGPCISDPDSITVAKACLVFDNNGFGGALLPSGAGPYVFAGTVTIVLNDTSGFAGLAPGKLCADFFGAGTFGTLCEAGEVFAAPVGTTATLAAIPSATLTAISQVIPISYQASGTASLGVSRTISVSGTITPTVGAAHGFNNTGNPVFGVVFGPAVAFNPTFWVWSANATQLWTPYFTTNGGFISRFVFQNTGAGAVLYSAVCSGEAGNVVTPGVNAAGSLNAGTTVISAASVCTFSGATRGSVIFTIAAPASTIKGAYNLVNPNTLSPAIIEMERPYNGPTF